MKQAAVLVLSFVFLVAFVLLSKYEDRQFVRNVDFTVTVKTQDVVAKFCTSRCDRVFEDAGFFASPLFSSFSLIVTTMIMVVKTKGWRKIFSLGTPLLFLLLTAAEGYGKTFVRHPAPPFFMLKHPTALFPTYYVWQEFSYPSGHAARAVFLALALFSAIQQWSTIPMRKRVWVGIGLGIYGALVSISRIYLGHHWLSDVVGGWLLGGALGVLTWAILPPYNCRAMGDREYARRVVYEKTPHGGAF